MSSTLRLRWRLARAYVRLLPPEIKMPTPDRDVLERVVFGALFRDPAVHAIAFVGCAGYTAWYPALFRFRPGLRFATIDRDPAQTSYGARRDHHVATLDSFADQPGTAASFEIVVLNGVVGYGMDSPEEQAVGLAAAHRLLRPGGRLVVGYDKTGDVATLEPVDPAAWREARVPGTERHRLETASNLGHVFVSYEAV